MNASGTVPLVITERNKRDDLDIDRDIGSAVTEIQARGNESLPSTTEARAREMPHEDKDEANYRRNDDNYNSIYERTKLQKQGI